MDRFCADSQSDVGLCLTTEAKENSGATPRTESPDSKPDRAEFVRSGVCLLVCTISLVAYLVCSESVRAFTNEAARLWAKM